MTYNDILTNIFTALPMYHKIGSSAYKEGLENIEAITAIIGNPEKRLKCIHVAGTNGKGSVTHLLSSFYQEMGLKVGLYTSPHLVDFRERIKVNGEMMPEEAVVEFFEHYNNDFQKLEPSFFEMTTAMAFYYFAQQKVDIAIIEVGLGGRLDATNVILPEMCVITNISFDHTQLLGDTLEKIAGEKAGIIKPNIPVVIGKRQPETMPVFEAKSAELNAPLFTTENVTVTPLAESRVSSHAVRFISLKYNDEVIADRICLPLPGDYQLENVATFVKAVMLRHSNRPDICQLIVRAIENVLRNTHLRGRWEVVSEQPLTICDTGHNSGGFAFLSQQLQNLDCQQLYCIIGFVNDKDIDSIIHLLPRQAEYLVCKASVARAQEPAVIVGKMIANGLQATASELSVFATYQSLIQRINKNAAVYVGGSTFIVADFLKEFE
ncbi:MAG: bifunctional folylpolyglutamate synthase/dihydrofolate synthase [Bacteroidales bacterium]|nr:bifunctional folylpolyglutamate synthase/dihydrofolate synthase [Bacteroidales bacterium]